MAMQKAPLALRMLWRDWRAGELTLLAAAIVIAVAGLTTVSFFTDRVQRALVQQSNQLLGADLSIVSDRPFADAFAVEAQARGLAVTRALRFPSMTSHGDESLLSDIKVVAPGYPLRGEIRLADALFGAERVTRDVPAAGTAWVDDRLLTRLNVKVGDTLAVGQLRLRVAAIVTQEPDSAIGFINSAPRVLMNETDAAATGLLQAGSRVRYRLYIAGETAVVDAYRAWAQSRIGPGQSIEGIRDARPEIRSALEKAERFLGLAALVSVVLSAVAIALAARRFVRRHLDGCAVMRCMGARQSAIIRLYVLHFTVLGLVAGALGCVIGYIAQFALAAWLGSFLAVALPWPGAAPAGYGLAAGVLLLLGFALPPLVSLAQVSTLRVLRRDLGLPRGWGAAGYVLGLAVICSLVLWKAQDLRLGAYVVGGFVAAAAVSAGVVLGLLRLLSGLRAGGGVSFRYGLANLRRHALGNTLQVVALALGMMALLTLTLIRGDLLHSWQANLKPDAPNRFVVSVQPEQVAPLKAFFSAHGIAQPAIFPMVRGRLTAINGRAVSSDDYAEERAKRLVDREFNLSWAEHMQPGNRILAGKWWEDAATRPEQLSVEEGIAAVLGLKLGDRLTYDVAGSSFEGTITSMRKVEWESFRANFFVIAPPQLLEKFPASYMTSLFVPAGQTAVLNELVRDFPNLIVIDVAQIMAQVQKMMDQVASAVQFVFLFTLAAGLIVLYAAIASTRDEREHETAVMRALGASRRQIAAVQFAEFALIGTLAGLLAAAGASALGYVLAHKVLNVPYAGNGWIWLVGICAGGAGIAAAGMLGTWRVLATSPLRVLNDA
ncbi:MAG: FtsX-like permease family protein [Burkholderiales bacterium]